MLLSYSRNLFFDARPNSSDKNELPLRFFQFSKSVLCLGQILKIITIYTAVYNTLTLQISQRPWYALFDYELDSQLSI